MCVTITMPATDEHEHHMEGSNGAGNMNNNNNNSSSSGGGSNTSSSRTSEDGMAASRHSGSVRITSRHDDTSWIQRADQSARDSTVRMRDKNPVPKRLSTGNNDSGWIKAGGVSGRRAVSSDDPWLRSPQIRGRRSTSDSWKIAETGAMTKSRRSAGDAEELSRRARNHPIADDVTTEAITADHIPRPLSATVISRDDRVAGAGVTHTRHVPGRLQINSADAQSWIKSDTKEVHTSRSSFPEAIRTVTSMSNDMASTQEAKHRPPEIGNIRLKRENFERSLQMSGFIREGGHDHDAPARGSGLSSTGRSEFSARKYENAMVKFEADRKKTEIDDEPPKRYERRARSIGRLTDRELTIAGTMESSKEYIQSPKFRSEVYGSRSHDRISKRDGHLTRNNEETTASVDEHKHVGDRRSRRDWYTTANHTTRNDDKVIKIDSCASVSRNEGQTAETDPCENECDLHESNDVIASNHDEIITRSERNTSKNEGRRLRRQGRAWRGEERTSRYDGPSSTRNEGCMLRSEGHASRSDTSENEGDLHEREKQTTRKNDNLTNTESHTCRSEEHISNDEEKVSSSEEHAFKDEWRTFRSEEHTSTDEERPSSSEDHASKGEESPSRSEEHISKDERRPTVNEGCTSRNEGRLIRRTRRMFRNDQSGQEGNHATTDEISSGASHISRTERPTSRNEEQTATIDRIAASENEGVFCEGDEITKDVANEAGEVQNQHRTSHGERSESSGFRTTVSSNNHALEIVHIDGLTPRDHALIANIPMVANQSCFTNNHAEVHQSGVDISTAQEDHLDANDRFKALDQPSVDEQQTEVDAAFGDQLVQEERTAVVDSPLLIEQSDLDKSEALVYQSSLNVKSTVANLESTTVDQLDPDEALIEADRSGAPADESCVGVTTTLGSQSDGAGILGTGEMHARMERRRRQRDWVGEIEEEVPQKGRRDPGEDQKLDETKYQEIAGKVPSEFKSAKVEMVVKQDETVESENQMAVDIASNETMEGVATTKEDTDNDIASSSAEVGDSYTELDCDRALLDGRGSNNCAIIDTMIASRSSVTEGMAISETIEDEVNYISQTDDAERSATLCDINLTLDSPTGKEEDLTQAKQDMQAKPKSAEQIWHGRDEKSSGDLCISTTTMQFKTESNIEPVLEIKTQVADASDMKHSMNGDHEHGSAIESALLIDNNCSTALPENKPYSDILLENQPPGGSSRHHLVDKQHTTQLEDTKSFTDDTNKRAQNILVHTSLDDGGSAYDDDTGVQGQASEEGDMLEVLKDLDKVIAEYTPKLSDEAYGLAMELQHADSETIKQPQSTTEESSKYQETSICTDTVDKYEQMVDLVEEQTEYDTTQSELEAIINEDTRKEQLDTVSDRKDHITIVDWDQWIKDNREDINVHPVEFEEPAEENETITEENENDENVEEVFEWVTWGLETIEENVEEGSAQEYREDNAGEANAGKENAEEEDAEGRTDMTDGTKYVERVEGEKGADEEREKQESDLSDNRQKVASIMADNQCEVWDDTETRQVDISHCINTQSKQLDETNKLEPNEAQSETSFKVSHLQKEPVGDIVLGDDTGALQSEMSDSTNPLQTGLDLDGQIKVNNTDYDTASDDDPPSKLHYNGVWTCRHSADLAVDNDGVAQAISEQVTGSEFNHSKEPYTHSRNIENVQKSDDSKIISEAHDYDGNEKEELYAIPVETHEQDRNNNQTSEIYPINEEEFSQMSKAGKQTVVSEALIAKPTNVRDEERTHSADVSKCPHPISAISELEMYAGTVDEGQKLRKDVYNVDEIQEMEDVVQVEEAQSAEQVKDTDNCDEIDEKEVIEQEAAQHGEMGMVKQEKDMDNWNEITEVEQDTCNEIHEKEKEQVVAKQQKDVADEIHEKEEPVVAKQQTDVDDEIHEKEAEQVIEKQQMDINEKEEEQVIKKQQTDIDDEIHENEQVIDGIHEKEEEQVIEKPQNDINEIHEKEEEQVIEKQHTDIDDEIHEKEKEQVIDKQHTYIDDEIHEKEEEQVIEKQHTNIDDEIHENEQVIYDEIHEKEEEQVIEKPQNDIHEKEEEQVIEKQHTDIDDEIHEKGEEQVIEKQHMDIDEIHEKEEQVIVKQHTDIDDEIHEKEEEQVIEKQHMDIDEIHEKEEQVIEKQHTDIDDEIHEKEEEQVIEKQHTTIDDEIHENEQVIYDEIHEKEEEQVIEKQHTDIDDEIHEKKQHTDIDNCEEKVEYKETLSDKKQRTITVSDDASITNEQTTSESLLETGPNIEQLETHTTLAGKVSSSRAVVSEELLNSFELSTTTTQSELVSNVSTTRGPITTGATSQDEILRARLKETALGRHTNETSTSNNDDHQSHYLDVIRRDMTAAQKYVQATRGIKPKPSKPEPRQAKRESTEEEVQMKNIVMWLSSGTLRSTTSDDKMLTSTGDVTFEDLILEVFEESETLFFPLQTPKEARAFIKALHSKGVTYESLCQEIGEPEHNFTSWRKSLGRAGVGHAVMAWVNQPLQLMLDEDAEDDEDDDTNGDAEEEVWREAERREEGQRRLQSNGESQIMKNVVDFNKNDQKDHHTSADKNGVSGIVCNTKSAPSNATKEEHQPRQQYDQVPDPIRERRLLEFKSQQARGHEIEAAISDQGMKDIRNRISQFESTSRPTSKSGSESREESDRLEETESVSSVITETDSVSSMDETDKPADNCASTDTANVDSSCVMPDVTVETQLTSNGSKTRKSPSPTSESAHDMLDGDITENYNSDLDVENDMHSPVQAVAARKITASRATKTWGGFLYVFSDTPANSETCRVKVGVSTFPRKRLRQAQLFNPDVYQVRTVAVRHQAAALQQVLRELEPYRLPGQRDWFEGPFNDIITAISKVAASFPSTRKVIHSTDTEEGESTC